jgi:hypothetical protein
VNGRQRKRNSLSIKRVKSSIYIKTEIDGCTAVRKMEGFYTEKKLPPFKSLKTCAHSFKKNGIFTKYKE